MGGCAKGDGQGRKTDEDGPDTVVADPSAFAEDRASGDDDAAAREVICCYLRRSLSTGTSVNNDAHTVIPFREERTMDREDLVLGGDDERASHHLSSPSPISSQCSAYTPKKGFASAQAGIPVVSPFSLSHGGRLTRIASS